MPKPKPGGRRPRKRERKNVAIGALVLVSILLTGGVAAAAAEGAADVAAAAEALPADVLDDAAHHLTDRREADAGQRHRVRHRQQRGAHAVEEGAASD